jgi:hypothetical protein
VRFFRVLSLCMVFSYSLFPVEAQQDLASNSQQPALNNDGVLAMVRERFDDATIVRMIQTHSTNFDLSVDAMIRLKQAGVSQSVLQAMIAAVPDPTAGPPPAQPAVARYAPIPTAPVEAPDEIGVYVRQKGKLVAIEPEIVNWQTGGVAKHVATLGLDREHLNGTVAAAHSGLTVSPSPLGMAGPIEFIIRCPDGNSASEYQLLRFWEKADRREFRSVTGGVLHASSGAKDNVIAFQFEKIAPRTYKVALPSIGTGEFGFLAPGMAASADMASRGKVYTFRIIE